MISFKKIMINKVNTIISDLYRVACVMSMTVLSGEIFQIFYINCFLPAFYESYITKYFLRY